MAFQVPGVGSVNQQNDELQAILEIQRRVSGDIAKAREAGLKSFLGQQELALRSQQIGLQRELAQQQFGLREKQFALDEAKETREAEAFRIGKERQAAEDKAFSLIGEAEEAIQSQFPESIPGFIGPPQPEAPTGLDADLRAIQDAEEEATNPITRRALSNEKKRILEQQEIRAGIRQKEAATARIEGENQFQFGDEGSGGISATATGVAAEAASSLSDQQLQGLGMTEVEAADAMAQIASSMIRANPRVRPNTFELKEALKKTRLTDLQLDKTLRDSKLSSEIDKAGRRALSEQRVAQEEYEEEVNSSVEKHLDTTVKVQLIDKELGTIKEAIESARSELSSIPDEDFQTSIELLYKDKVEEFAIKNAMNQGGVVKPRLRVVPGMDKPAPLLLEKEFSELKALAVMLNINLETVIPKR